MNWLDFPRGEKLYLLDLIGLRKRDAKRTLLLAEAAQPQPAPYSPLVGGILNPNSMVAHKRDGDDRAGCGATWNWGGRPEEITPGTLARMGDHIEPCRRCFNIDGRTGT